MPHYTSFISMIVDVRTPDFEKYCWKRWLWIWGSLKKGSELVFEEFNQPTPQTRNLSKILHRQIFRLQAQFHLILTVLVRKSTKNEWKLD